MISNIAPIRPITLTGSIALEPRWVPWLEQPHPKSGTAAVPAATVRRQEPTEAVEKRVRDVRRAVFFGHDGVEAL
jgi:hypothetical protein